MRFHSIDAGEAGYAIYFPDTFRLIKGNDNTVKLFTRIAENAPFKELENEFSITEEEFESYKIMMGDGITHELPERNRNHLDELIVHVSNDCNMRCLYCYGQGGCYNMERELMKEETVIEALEKMYAIYPEIDLINFFGGEPTLNLPVIKAACKYVKSKNKKTVVGMVSNGTCANEEILELIRDYDFRITFSVDVPAMQDKLRPLVGGKPSYETVYKNFKYLKERTSEPSGIEITYTEQHRQKGISVEDTIRQTRAIFGDVPMIFNPVSSTNPNYKLSDFSGFAECVDAFENEKDLYDSTPHILGVANALKNKKVKYQFCPSGFGKTSISSKGDIYACQAFLGEEEFRFGNISEPLDVLKARVWEKSDAMYNIDKFHADGCKDCYLNTFCHRCINDNRMETGKLDESPADLCQMQKDVFDKVLVNKIKKMA